MDLAWATTFNALPNHHLLITICDSVLDYPTCGATSR
jgi:hypothetical protein